MGVAEPIWCADSDDPCYRLKAGPVSSVSGIEVLRRLRGGRAASSRMRLHIGTRTPRTRPGPTSLPTRRDEAVAIAEISTTVREKIENDDWWRSPAGRLVPPSLPSAVWSPRGANLLLEGGGTAAGSALTRVGPYRSDG